VSPWVTRPDSVRDVDSVRQRAGAFVSFLTRRYPRQSAVEGLRERLTAVSVAARPALRQPHPEHEEDAMTTQQLPSSEHSLNIREPYFDLIATGAKTIEIRVGYAKIRKMAAGDSLRFNSGDDTLLTRIIALKEYPSFEEMLDVEDNTAIGEPGMTRDELLAACRAIYPPEKEALGVFAIHLDLLPG
jgi:ASC-1-like (ASCH) protein